MERKTMFDMRKIGRKISELRKSRNMTQMALADALGISFQAVSNWERGESMPDIAKLGELSQIFGVPIDDILCNTRAAEVVKEISSGDPAADITPAELADAAPILSPAQVEVCAKEQTVRFTFTDVAALAPFLDSKTLADIVLARVEEGCTVEELVTLAPLMDSDDLDRLVHQKLDGTCDIGELVALAPFLEEGTLSGIAKTRLESGCSVSELSALAPFLDEDAVAEIVRDRLKSGCSVKEISELAPFMDEDAVTEIVKDRLGSGCSIEEIAELAPFMDETALGEIVKKYFLR